MNVRELKILKYLLENKKVDIKGLAEKFAVTERMIYYDVCCIDHNLENERLTPIIKSGKTLSLAFQDLNEIKGIIEKKIDVLQ